MKNNRKTVLVVEDSPSQAINIRLLLEQNGFEVLWAPDGRIGVLMAEEYRPDVIVMDLEMPDMDGFEAVQALKENAATAEIPVVMLTIKSSPEALMRCTELGIKDYIVKDAFSTMVLMGTLSQLGILANNSEDQVV